MKKIIFCVTLSLFIFQNSFGQLAPNFTVTDSDGQVHRLYEDYLDQGKTVVIDIFFVNCPPCAAIAPFLQDEYELWGSGSEDVQFIELSNKSGDTNAEVSDWKDQLGTEYPGVGNDGDALIALDPYLAGDFGPFFGVPTLIVIAPDRTVNFDISGSGVLGKIDALNNAIAATGATGGAVVIEPTVYEFEFKDAFDKDVDDVIVTIGSQDQTGQTYDVVISNGQTLSIQNIDDQFPGITNPTFFFTKEQANIKEKLSGADLSRIVKHALGLEQLNSLLTIAADGNSDGNVTILDLLIFQQIILGLRTEYPAGSGSWKTIPQNVSLDLTPGATNKIEIQLIRTGDMNDF